MAVRIQVRRDSYANWMSQNPVLAPGEIGFITDQRKVKVGDGSNAFNALQFLVGGSEADMLAKINANTSSIQQEAATRSSADAGLQSNLNAEAAARSESDNELSGRILALEESPSVPEGLQEQVDANTESIQGLVQNDEALTEALNGKLGLPQGQLTELKDPDWLIIGRTDPNLGTTPTYLSTLATLKEELGGGTDPEPPTPTTVLSWTFAGETFFQAPPEGGFGVNPSGSTIYVSKTNAAGQDITTEFENEFRAGNLFSLQVPARTNGDTGDTTQYMQFSIQQNPVNQGNWWNVATQRIINANDQNPWEVGQNLDAVVSVAPTTRTLMTSPEEQPEELITDPGVLEKWYAWKGLQGWEEEYTPAQADVNKFFIEIDQQQEAQIRALTEQIGALCEAPQNDEQYARKNAAWEVVDVDAPMHLEFEWQGEEWWPDKVKEGEMFGHKSEESLFFSETDENGLNSKTIMQNIVKSGTTIFVTKTKDRSRWAHFTARSGINDQGSFMNVSVNLNAKSEKDIKEDDDVTVMFNVSAPMDIPEMIPAEKVLELEELLGKMRKEISTLKASVTRLKNGNGK